MLRLWPTSPDGRCDDDDLAAELVGLPREPPHSRAWVMTNMVSSLDGAASRTGRTGALGGDGDRRMFHVIRSLPDAILVGAGTVRAERYRPVTALNVAGRAPKLAIVSARLDLDPTLPCLADADDDHRPIILTVVGSDPDRRRELEPLAELVDVGEGAIDPAALPPLLAERGYPIVLCEGGPTLLGQLLQHDVVDEWFVTVAAIALGGSAHRITNGADEVDRPVRLRTAFTEDEDLFLSYVKADATPEH